MVSEHLRALGDGKWCVAHCNLNILLRARLGQRGAVIPWDLAQDDNLCNLKGEGIFFTNSFSPLTSACQG